MRIPKKLYRSYINSDEWKKVKQKYMQSNLPKECYCCNKKHGTFTPEFHHRTYKRLGNERLLDIVPVCRECHAKIHTVQNESNLSIWASTQKIRKRMKGKAMLSHSP